MSSDGLLCWSCIGIIHNGERRRTPAAYRWTTPVGNVVDLCVDCCASWRANAVADPGLAPLSITSLRGEATG